MDRMIETAYVISDETIHYFDVCLHDYSRLSIMIMTIIGTIVFLKMLTIVNNCSHYVTCVKRRLGKAIRHLPPIRKKIECEMARLKIDVHEDIHKMDDEAKFFTALPKNGLKHDEIVRLSAKYNAMSTIDWNGGKQSASTYIEHMDELDSMLFDIFKYNVHSNALYPAAHPSVRKIEAEIVRMTLTLFGGASESCGTVTTGGTESILCSMLAYRNLAYENGISTPELLICSCAHAAFYKAGEYFDLKVIEIPFDKNYRLDVEKLKKRIDRNTAVIVASAPCFGHGIIDDIDRISEIAYKTGKPLHVDACLGGFQLPYLYKSGELTTRVDFTQRGITSISCDIHKYGFSPKGASVIMYSDKKYLHAQYFTKLSWNGGYYASATLSGSRGGLNSAMAWATMLYFGDVGYARLIQEIRDVTKKIQQSLSNENGLEMIGESEVSTVCFTSKQFNPYALLDKMGKRGWVLGSQQNPPSFHIVVTHTHTQPGVADQFIKDMKECVEIMRNNPDHLQSKTASMYGLMASVPSEELLSEFAAIYLDELYSTN